MSEWQPIETAPRDGTPIWLKGAGVFHGIEFVAYRRQPEWPWEHETWRMPIGDRDIPDHCVTHWMPRPAQPQDLADRQAKWLRAAGVPVTSDILDLDQERAIQQMAGER